MATGQSRTDICNSALLRLGAATIADITDNSPEARACAIQYDSNRRSELRRHPWNFAIKRVVLAPDTAAPAFEFDAAFSLPADCLRVILPNDSTIDWVIEGGKILTSWSSSPVTGSTTANTLSLRYVQDVEDVTKFDAAFYDALCCGLAIDICDKLTSSNAKKQTLMEEYKGIISEARRSDAIENLPEDPPDSSWLTVRY
jgi:hypothetical protein